MNYTVHLSTRAEHDVRKIVGWIRRRSPKGALLWLAAFDEMLERLETFSGHAIAPENNRVELTVYQVFFKTRYGNFYRALYSIDGSDIFILRVRTKGQQRVRANNLL